MKGKNSAWIKVESRLTIQALLLMLLLFAQFHYCVQRYVDVKGQDCLPCASITHIENPNTGVAASHGDCHDCCSIQSCEDHLGVDAIHAKASQSFSVCLVADRCDAPDFAPIDIVWETYFFNPGNPSHGPPLLRASRAPPFFSLV